MNKKIHMFLKTNLGKSSDKSLPSEDFFGPQETFVRATLPINIYNNSFYYYCEVRQAVKACLYKGHFQGRFWACQNLVQTCEKTNQHFQGHQKLGVTPGRHFSCLMLNGLRNGQSFCIHLSWTAGWGFATDNTHNVANTSRGNNWEKKQSRYH